MIHTAQEDNNTRIPSVPNIPDIPPAQLAQYREYLITQEIPITNIELFVRAITHKSCIDYGAHKQVELYNETLEFLGDSILGLIISVYLFETYPHHDQGYLSKLKSYIVSKQSLFKVAEDLNVIQVMHVRGIDLEQGKFSSILADAVEALIGAIYVESGLEITKQFVLKNFIPLIDLVEQEDHDKDFKSILQHYSQKYHNTKPSYEVKSTSGPDHNKSFALLVKVGSKIFGPCTAGSKKLAEQKVAKLACESLYPEVDHEKFF